MTKAMIVPFLLMLAACGAEPSDGGNALARGGNASAGNGVAALDGSNAAPALPTCAFHDTHDWFGGIEGGRLTIQGRVDLQMAGFAPVLTERRSEAPDTIAFDLTLSPAPNAPVTFTSKMSCQSALGTSSSGRPICPSTPPALFTRTSARPSAATASATKCSTAVRSVMSTTRVSHAPPAGASAAAGLRVTTWQITQEVFSKSCVAARSTSRSTSALLPSFTVVGMATGRSACGTIWSAAACTGRFSTMWLTAR